MFLIAGLGNPGKKYEKTRHNLGFMVIDELARRNSVSVDKSKFKSLTGEFKLGGEKGNSYEAANIYEPQWRSN